MESVLVQQANGVFLVHVSLKNIVQEIGIVEEDFIALWAFAYQTFHAEGTSSRHALMEL